MKKTKPIKDRLHRHRRMIEKLKALEIELSFAERQYETTGGSGLSAAPGGSSGKFKSRTESVVMAKVAIDEKIEAQRQAIAEDWAELEPMIEQLTPIQELVMNLRYKRGAEWDEVNRGIFEKRKDFEIDYDRYMNKVFKAHGKALLTLSGMFDASDGTPTE